MAKMQWDAARRRKKVATDHGLAARYLPLYAERTNPVEKIRVRPSLPHAPWHPPFEGVGVSYIRSGVQVIGVGLSRSGEDAPDFVCADARSAIELVDELRSELANDNHEQAAVAA